MRAIGGAGLWLCGCYAAPSTSSEPPTADLEAAPEPSSWAPWESRAPSPDGPAPEEPDDDADGPDPSRDDVWRWRGELNAATSPERPQLLAIWTEAGVLLSRDDAASFQKIFEDATRIWDVALENERVWVLHGRQLHRLDPDGSEHSWPMPPYVDTDLWFASVDDYGTAPQLAASANWVVVAVPHPDTSRLVRLVGRHRGGRWRTSLAESAMDSASIGVNAYQGLRVDQRGRVEVTVDWGQGTECGVGYISSYRGRLGQALRLGAEYQDPFEQFRAHDGLVYGYCPEQDDERLCVHPLSAARPANDREVELPWTPTTPEIRVEDQLTVVRSRTRTVAIADRRLLALDGGRTTTLATDAPDDVELLSVDALGRPVLASGLTIVRWAPGRGWSPLPLELESIRVP